MKAATFLSAPPLPSQAGAASVDLLVDGPRHFVSRTSTGRFFALLECLGVSTDTMVHDLLLSPSPEPTLALAPEPEPELEPEPEPEP